mgnify:CR=1 FL=1
MTEFIPPGTRYHPLPSPFAFKRGGELHGAHVAFETWGALNETASNAVLIVTGLSPDAHAAANADNGDIGRITGNGSVRGLAHRLVLFSKSSGFQRLTCRNACGKRRKSGGRHIPPTTSPG